MTRTPKQQAMEMAENLAKQLPVWPITQAGEVKRVELIIKVLGLEQLIEDKIRLDWLEKNTAYITLSANESRSTMKTLATRGLGHANGELRQAISTAMKEGKQC